MGLNVSVVNDEECFVISLSGKIDISSHDQLLKVLYHVLSVQKKKIIIDMSEISFISSNGIGALMEARNFTINQNGQFILTGLNSKIYNVFELIGVLDKLSVFDTIEAAMKALDYRTSLHQAHH